MSAYLHRNLAPMTPIQPYDGYYGDIHEPAIVDPSTFEGDSVLSLLPHSHSGVAYRDCINPSLSAYTPFFDAPAKADMDEYRPTIDLSVPSPLPPIAVLPPTASLTGDMGDLAAVTAPVVAGPVDMNMAKPGTVSATPGFLTPIATHVAQLAAWFWFSPGPTPFTASPTTSPASSSATPGQDTSLIYGAINPLQVQVPAAFSDFVERLLRLTSVSHSVVLISLLYLSRLTQKSGLCGLQGTENGAFTVSLMLANKYLDDNTYTNRTWADLSNIALSEITRLESRFLQGLEWSLKVDQGDFDTWSKFLDGFMLSHSRQVQRHFQTASIDQSASHSSTLPSTSVFREAPRARSHSPREVPAEPSANAAFISPTTGRKRSAGDAFPVDSQSTEQAAKSMRIPQRRGYVHLPGSAQLHPHLPSGGLTRAASLTREARFGATAGRRGSTPGLSGQFNPMNGSQNGQHAQSAWQPTTSLHQAPHFSAESLPQNVNYGGQYEGPEHLVFYTLAAEAHPGQDGSRRKGTLHYQVPQSQYYPTEHAQYQSYPAPSQYPVSTQYPPSSLTPSYMSSSAAQPAFTPMVATPADGGFGHGYLSSAAPTPDHFGYPQQYAFGQPAVPAPAQFANAGPPAYQYRPHGYHPQQINALPGNYPFTPSHPLAQHSAPGPPAAWNGGLASGYAAHPPQHSQHARAMMQSRSEWSSPLPGFGRF